MKAKTSIKKKYYDQQYLKNNYKQFAIMLNKDKDSDIVEYLQNKKDRNAYLKALIRADMDK